MSSSLLDCFLKGLSKSSNLTGSNRSQNGTCSSSKKGQTNPRNPPVLSPGGLSTTSSQSQNDHPIHIITITPDYSSPPSDAGFPDQNGGLDHDHFNHKVSRLRSNSCTPGTPHPKSPPNSHSSPMSVAAPSSLAGAQALPAHPLIMSDIQGKLLRKAWRRVGRKGDTGFGTLIFKHLFTKSPHIRGLFGFGMSSVSQLRGNDALFRNHARLFVRIISDAIGHLENLSQVTIELEEQGRFHANFQEYGFRAEYWDMMGEAVTESAMEWAGTGKHAELNRAWMILVTYIVDTLRNSYEQEVKRRKRTTRRASQWSASRQSSMSHEDLTLIGKIEPGAVSSHPSANYASSTHLEKAPSPSDRRIEGLSASTGFPPRNGTCQSALKSERSPSDASAPIAINTLAVPELSSKNRRRSLPLGGRTTMDIVEEFGLSMRAMKH